MVKGISNAFDQYGTVFGHKFHIGNRLLYVHQCLLLGILVLLLPFIPGSKFLLLRKKLISVTERVFDDTVFLPVNATFEQKNPLTSLVIAKYQ